MPNGNQDQASNKFEEIARLIREVNIPISKGGYPMVPGECNDPQCWINHYAEGFARYSTTYTKESAAREIRCAFERLYKRSPEEILSSK